MPAETQAQPQTQADARKDLLQAVKGIRSGLLVFAVLLAGKVLEVLLRPKYPLVALALSVASVCISLSLIMRPGVRPPAE